MAGVRSAESVMSEKPQAVILQDMIPNEGDSIMIVNCGDYYEMHSNSRTPHPLVLTETDIERLKQGLIVWN